MGCRAFSPLKLAVYLNNVKSLVPILQETENVTMTN